MTDRAAVMKKFDADFLNFIRTQVGQEAMVHFLHCNAHFLLGLSRSTDLALQAAEKAVTETSGTALGRDKCGEVVGIIGKVVEKGRRIC